jgi:hypothetical protein
MVSNNNRQQPAYESVDGIEITVETKKKEYPTLPVKEWLLAKITEVKKQIPDREGWGPKLHWTFSLVDEQYSSRKMWYDTSMIATPDSKLYALYIEIMGLKELSENQVIKPNDLISRTCYIIVEPAKKYPDRQVIASIKHHDGKDAVASVAKQAVATSAKKEVPVAAAAATTTQKQADSGDELNLDDINVDDL